MHASPAESAFADLARRYCAEIDAATSTPRGEFLRRIHMLLPALYSAALALPGTEHPAPDEQDVTFDEAAEDAASRAQAEREVRDRRTHAEWTALYLTLAEAIGEPGNHYSEMFDPYGAVDAEPSMGSLADDLADIYGDLSDGLAKWDRGERARASWTWRFNFIIHWGEHVTGALRALHALADQHGRGFPGDPLADV